MSSLCLRGVAGGGLSGIWWVLFVDERSGCVSVMSDYGDYSHRWPAQWTGFRTTLRFLATAGDDYLLDKFTYGFESKFDHERTQKLLREDLIERRREGRIDRETARAAWDATADVYSADDFRTYVEAHDEAHDGGALYEMACFDKTLGAPTLFIKEAWPSIRVAIIAQLERDRHPLDPDHCRSWGNECQCAGEVRHG